MFTTEAVISDIKNDGFNLWIAFECQEKYFSPHWTFDCTKLGDYTKIQNLLSITKSSNTQELIGKKVRIIDSGAKQNSLLAIGSLEKNKFIDLYGNEFLTKENTIYQHHNKSKKSHLSTKQKILLITIYANMFALGTPTFHQKLQNFTLKTVQTDERNFDFDKNVVSNILPIQKEYKLEELRLIATPTTLQTKYYFVKYEDTILKKNETSKTISPINFYVKYGTKNEEQQLLERIPLRFTITKNTITLSPSATIPCYELRQNAWVEISLPKELRNKKTFTQAELAKIEELYNYQGFDWENNYFNNKYNISSLYIVKQNDENLIISEENAIQFPQTGITLYPSVNNSQKGFLNEYNNGQYNKRFTSKDPNLDFEYSLTQQEIIILPIESFLTEEQLQKRYLTKEEILNVTKQKEISKSLMKEED